MKDIWFLSDTHFHHSNILKFVIEDGSKVRPEFTSVEEMDEYMIEQWNSKIKPNDYVYHLGDISMNETRFLNETVHKLNGQIRMVLGNHDNDVKAYAKCNKIKKIMVSRRFDEHGFICSHYPLHKFSLFNHRTNGFHVNVHGHIHSHDIGEKGWLNISVEKTGYSPIHLDQLIELVKENRHND